MMVEFFSITLTCIFLGRNIGRDRDREINRDRDRDRDWDWDWASKRHSIKT